MTGEVGDFQENLLRIFNIPQETSYTGPRVPVRENLTKILKSDTWP